MNCRDFEKNIYVYPELTEKEKAGIDNHIKSCDQCAKLFRDLQQAQFIVKQIAEYEISPPNDARLTSAIMSRITQPSEPTWLDLVTQFFQNQRLRIALSIASSVLVFFFLFESSHKFIQPKNDMRETSESVILNATAFRQAASKRRNIQQPFAGCRSPFKSNQFFLECAKTKLLKSKSLKSTL